MPLDSQSVQSQRNCRTHWPNTGYHRHQQDHWCLKIIQKVWMILGGQWQFYLSVYGHVNWIFAISKHDVWAPGHSRCPAASQPSWSWWSDPAAISAAPAAWSLSTGRGRTIPFKDPLKSTAQGLCTYPFVKVKKPQHPNLPQFKVIQICWLQIDHPVLNGNVSKRFPKYMFIWS